MENRSRSTLFLMEQLMVILIFAICSAVCVKIFVDSYIVANASKDLKNSLIVAENGAESYKAFAGSAHEVSSNLGGTYANADDGSEITVFFDEEWQHCREDDAAYVMRILSRATGDSSPLRSGDLSVETMTGREIVSFTVRTRAVEYE